MGGICGKMGKNRVAPPIYNHGIILNPTNLDVVKRDGVQIVTNKMDSEQEVRTYAVLDSMHPNRYFEIKVMSPPADRDLIAIGFMDRFKAKTLLGVIYEQDGSVLNHVREPLPNVSPLPPFGQGDVVGCGLIQNKGQTVYVYFTKNGVKLKKEVHYSGGHRPIVRLGGRQKVEINFGDSITNPLLFDPNVPQNHVVRENAVSPALAPRSGGSVPQPGPAAPASPQPSAVSPAKPAVAKQEALQPKGEPSYSPPPSLSQPRPPVELPKTQQPSEPKTVVTTSPSSTAPRSPLGSLSSPIAVSPSQKKLPPIRSSGSKIVANGNDAPTSISGMY